MRSWQILDLDVMRYPVWAGAFLVAERVYRSYTDRGRDRFVLGLFVGAVFAHLGWALVHLPRVIEFPGWVLQPGAASVLFLPLGVMIVAPWREALKTYLGIGDQ